MRANNAACLGVNRARASPLAGLILLVYAVLVLLGGLACDRTFTITYENQTDKPIQIFLYGKFDLSLEPMETKTLDTIEFDEATFEARTLEGRVIFSETLTRADMEARDWRIVIVDSLREKS